MKRAHPESNDPCRSSLPGIPKSKSRRNRKIRPKPFTYASLLTVLVLVENAFVGVMIRQFNPIFDHCLIDCKKGTHPLSDGTGKQTRHPLVVPAASESVEWNMYAAFSGSNALTESTERAMKTLFPNRDDVVPCFQSNCNMTSKRVWAYNSWSRNMYLCGQTISPNTATELLGGCRESPRVFREDPTRKDALLTTEMINVTSYRKNRHFPSKMQNCTVPCQFADVGGHPVELTVEGTNWRILHSLESPAHYPIIAVRKFGWKAETYYSTTSFKSEIPIPYFWLEMEIKSAPVEYDKVIKGASFIASNCKNTRNNRLAVVEDLMKIIRVDSLGRCLHNAEPPDGVNKDLKDDLQKAYLFHLAFENSNVVDHITEKLWGTLRSGTLPVYMGAPNIKEHVPEHSIISWHDFKSTREMGEYLKLVAANKSLYESYHAWRFQPNLPEHLIRKYNFTSTHAACRTCKWAYAKQRGLGWDHEVQDIRPLYKSRALRFDGDNLVAEPFQEIQSVRSQVRSLTSVFHYPQDHLPKVATLGNWTRTVSYQDGVVDIFLEGSSCEAYRISTGMTAKWIKLQANLYQMQDKVSRITFAMDENIEVSFNGAGTVDFQTNGTSKTMKRIRVITEDVDTFHVGADEDLSYYGKLMVAQFENPLQFFKFG